MTRRQLIATVGPWFAGFQSPVMDRICLGSIMLSVVILAVLTGMVL